MSQVKVEVIINIDGDKIKVNAPLDKAAKLERSVPDLSKDAKDLELKLMTVDDNDDEKTMAVNMDVLSWAMKTLKAGKRGELLEFLNRNKDRFNPELKDMLKDTIKDYVGKNKK